MDDLIERFRAGDEEAVRVIYQRYGGAIQTVARSIVGDRELASDVVQQTFLKAWRAAGTFGVDRDLAPWLYAIARRTAIDALRSERRPTMSGHEREADVAVSMLSFERTWEIYEVRCALDELPPAERDAIRLTHLDGLTHTEVADLLGVPVGTVKSRTARGHRRLAVALGHLAPAANRSSQPNVQSGEE